MLANRTLDFCEMEDIVNHNVFLHSLLNHFLENLKFAIKCPFKKVREFERGRLLADFDVSRESMS
jgi:hypothetical protein